MNITIKDIKKAYGDKQVFDGLNLEFSEGEVNCLMGRSGCGKTTLLNLIMGIDRDYHGEIKGVPAHIGVVFQENRLCEDFSVLSNIRMVCDNADIDEIKANLDAVGLGDNLKTPVKDLSGGMKRRVALVRAILSRGELLILDEPFKGLDDDTRKSVAEYLLAGRKKRTVIMVTHDPEEVDMLGGRLTAL
ncbi:MAG: ABC transporter ATP-binding protein [Lachnospiraceae bacterium]|nr:ABC transporter ATP-binding protein [Lachnospiraceae bacterium]